MDVMNYNTLTPELSALCRQAMLDEEPCDLQEVPHFDTTFEQEKYEAEEQYAIWLADNLYTT